MDPYRKVWMHGFSNADGRFLWIALGSRNGVGGFVFYAVKEGQGLECFASILEMIVC